MIRIFNFKSPKISIVITCYNYGQYIDDAIESVQKQTFKDYEMIIVDDCSDDLFTINKLEQLKKEGHQIRRTERNSGPSAARNIGVKESKGKFIVTLDADDRLHPDFLKKTYNIISKRSDIRLVYTRVQFFGEKTHIWDLEEYNPDIFCVYNMIVSTAMYRKKDWEKIGGYCEKLLGWEDYDFWIGITQLGGKVIRIPEVLFYYRVGHSSRTVLTDHQKSELYKRVMERHPQFFIGSAGRIYNYIQNNIDSFDPMHCENIQIFWNAGDGWSEELSMTQRFRKDMVYEFKFKNSVTISDLRLDPGNLPSEVKIRKIIAYCEKGLELELSIYSTNGVEDSNGSYRFENIDPQIYAKRRNLQEHRIVKILIEFEKMISIGS